MTVQAGAGDTETFRRAIACRLGLQVEDARLGALAALLGQRLEQLHCTAQAYLHDLEHGRSSTECVALAQELTVAETYFFRHIEQFQALAETALPARMRAAPAPRPLRLLSAGCASGEEAYTLAIVAREAIADPAWGVAIRAVDLNPAALARAACARYSAWALRETPPEIQRRWFHADGREMILDEAVRAAVTFELRNLAAPDTELWQPDSYDVIFCRNVLMYFTPEQMRAAVAAMATALAPGGFLFLGHAETLRGVSDDFHLREAQNAFYYERKERGAAVRRAPVPADSAWFAAIQDANARLATLLPATLLPAIVGVPSGEVASPAARTMAQALDLLHSERFGDALACVRALPAEANRGPDLLLLEATLLAHGGRLDAAEVACRRLLLADELNAGAHYVLALCREGVADRIGAAEHDRTAAHLDPGFAMPRLHLGLLARRQGDRDAARRELRQARILFECEVASRLLLFGGGFSRRALIALCESALRDCGVPQ
jgi:chemotaxis protein methyltransferase CheR